MTLTFNKAYVYLILGAVSCSVTTDYYQRLITQESAKSAKYELPKNNEEFKKGIESVAINEYGEYDVVVVGAGSAGCVLATRLSETDEISVLLIEAGGEENEFNQIPAMYPYLQNSELNWGYYTTPQKHSCLGMNNTQCMAPRGKAIGGSSAINGLMYARGNCKDYDRWAALGNRGWSCKDVLPYFKKSENSQIRGDKGYHGKGGFWNVEYAIPSFPLFDNFINATLEANQSIVDYNGRNQIGSAIIQYNTKRGKRQSLGTAFLNNGRKRRNLRVLTKTLVTRIFIDSHTKEATGVEFVTKTRKFHVRAKKEVIISAGAINTPQLLMLSGIGPKTHLEEMKIPVIANLPVGQNLMDHPTIILEAETNYTVPNVSMKKLTELYLNGLGPLTTTKPSGGVSFIHTRNNCAQEPSIQIVFASPQAAALSKLQRSRNYNNAGSETKKINQKSVIQLGVLLLHGKSRGRILLKSRSPIDFPDIDVNMFEEQEDVDTLVEGVQYALNLLETEAFQKINVTLLEVPFCTNLKNKSKKYLECLIRHIADNGLHYCGTAAMGPDSKKFVVDDALRVHGVKNLRVVDASIFPLLVSGNTNAATVMVAEKAADLIKTKLGY